MIFQEYNGYYLAIVLKYMIYYPYTLHMYIIVQYYTITRNLKFTILNRRL